MNETLTNNSPSLKPLENICREVQGLYPDITQIQSFCSLDKKLTFLVHSKDGVFEEKVFENIQQEIMTRLPWEMNGYECFLRYIIQASSSGIIAQDKVRDADMNEVCICVEAEFACENIWIIYENGIFIVYGAAPRIHDFIRQFIVSQIPHTMPCPRISIRFQSTFELEKLFEIPRTSIAQQIRLGVRRLLEDVFAK